MEKIVVFFLFFALCWCQQSAVTRRITHEWVTIDYDWDYMGESRLDWLNDGSFIPWNCALAGLKQYQDRLFITVPRWRSGVPATLLEVIEEDGEEKLRPWPSFEIQNLKNDDHQIKYVQSMEIDPDGIMWVIDSSILNNLAPSGYQYFSPQLLLIDIETGEIQKQFDLSSVCVEDSSFLNDIVLDYKNGIAFISDAGGVGGLIMVNVETGEMVRYSGESTQAHPAPDNLYTLCGDEFEIGLTPVDGIAWDPTGQRLYYCPLAGYNLYSLDTRIFSDPTSTNAEIENSVIFHGEKPGISDGMTFSKKGKLYFGSMDDCSIRYWDPSEKTIDESSSIVLQSSDKQNCNWADTFGFDDENGRLLVATNRLPFFIFDQMDFTGKSGANFRVIAYDIDSKSYMYTGSDRKDNTNGSERLMMSGSVLVGIVGLILFLF